MTALARAFSFALICSVGIALILGSASSQPVSTVSRISDADFDRYSGAGECSIKGQAFFKTQGGDVKYGAGEMVNLSPDIPLLDEILRINAAAGTHAAVPPDVQPKWLQLARMVQADGEGKFEFDNLPCEAWWVASKVTWYVPNYGTQGGVLSAKVNLSPQNSPARVILTQ